LCVTGRSKKGPQRVGFWRNQKGSKIKQRQKSQGCWERYDDHFRGGNGEEVYVQQNFAQKKRLPVPFYAPASARESKEGKRDMKKTDAPGEGKRA